MLNFAPAPPPDSVVVLTGEVGGVVYAALYIIVNPVGVMAPPLTAVTRINIGLSTGVPPTTWRIDGAVLEYPEPPALRVTVAAV
jgi:hypothetical protein